MREERGMAYCGLACCVCSESDCPGCHARGCEHKAMCGILDCCMRKGIDGCYACDEFPCDEEMLRKRRMQVFNRCMRKAGPAEVMRCLNRNEKAGIQYHYADKLIGDYDLDCDCDIEELLMNGGVHSKG
ncbi:MAG: DUF3795 domain-containing protein [Erysipelotrichaceae bacterium]|nr:DUF3795 domain-containing protein [Erysipelotrichaceae bacterium]